MAQFINEAFTDATNTSLSNHPTVGATAPYASSWNRGIGSGDVTIQTNKLRFTDYSTGHLTTGYTTPDIGANANYSVAIDVIVTGIASNAGSFYLVARSDTAFNVGYYFGYECASSRWIIYDNDGSTMGTYSQSLSNSTTYRAKLSVNGTTITGSVDGVDRITGTSSQLATQGRAGMYLSSSNNPFFADFDNMSGDDLGAGGGATAVTMSGPTSGSASHPSANFTFAANGSITGTVIVTPTDSSGAGAFTPTTVSISTGSPTGTVTYTPYTTGARTINCTNNGSLSAPTNITYTASGQNISMTAVTSPTDPTTRNNLSGLKWASWDCASPSVATPDTIVGAPTDQGNWATTGGSGIVGNVALGATSRTSGQLVWFEITNSDGTTSQSPAEMAFSGPIAIV